MTTVIPFTGADYYVIEYDFTSPGEDLDTRTYIRNPDTGMFLGPVGWCKESYIEIGTDRILEWGGDNTGTGVESVLFSKAAYENVFGSSQSKVLLSLNAFWYTTPNTSFTVKITGYVGGEMAKTPYSWENPTATATYVNSESYVCNDSLTNLDDCIDGDFVTYLEIDYEAGTATFSKTLP